MASIGRVGLHTGQQTVAAAAWWRQNGEKIETLYLSNPPFNQPLKDRADQIAAWANLQFGLVRVNQPCFGKIVHETAALLKQYGVNVTYEVDSFVIGKLVKTEPLIEHLRASGFEKIAERIKAFVADLTENGKNIQSQEQWTLFLRKHHLPEEMDLDFNSYLRNFDFEGQLDDVNLKAINEAKFADKDGKQVTYKDECIRWLTKVGFNPKGCFTDVVNYLHMVSETKELPAVFMMDAEMDDDGVLSILRRLHQDNGSEMRVIVQLPDAQEVEYIANRYLGLGCEILRDPESRNLPALLKHHKI